MAENGAKNILVIDDDITILTAMRKILEHDYEVSLAKSAEVAWSILNNIQIDMILLDVEMPSISGLDFMKYLQESAVFCYIPVIFVTSHGTPDVIKQAMEFGVKYFLVKPVSPDILLKKIKAVFGETVPKASQETILKNLHLLEIACRTGKSADVETLIRELTAVRNRAELDAHLAGICADVANFEYAAAVKKINILTKSNVFKKNKGGQADG